MLTMIQWTGDKRSQQTFCLFIDGEAQVLLRRLMTALVCAIQMSQDVCQPACTTDLFPCSHIDKKPQVNIGVINKMYLGSFPFCVAGLILCSNMHKSSTLTLLDLNGTEPLLVSSGTSVFTLLFLAKMVALKKVLFQNAGIIAKINFVIYTCNFPTVTSKNVCEKGKFRK